MKIPKQIELIPGNESEWEVIETYVDEHGNPVTVTRPTKQLKYYNNPDIPPWDESLGEFSYE